MELNCAHQDLTSLPDYINRFDCRANKLTSLPRLPDSLEELDCMQNKLTSLPRLPNSLTHVFDHYNYIIKFGSKTCRKKLWKPREDFLNKVRRNVKRRHSVGKLVELF